MRVGWTEKELLEAVAAARSVRQVLGKLGLRQAGGNYATLKRYLQTYGICTDHFKGRAWNKGQRGFRRYKYCMDEILVIESTYPSFKLKNRLFAEGLKQCRCERCGWAER